MKFIFCLFMLSTVAVDAQMLIDWNTLANVTFEQKYAEELGITYDEASFGKWIAMLDGQEVKIAGYMIPLDGMGVSYVLSRNPNATCFFCGGAGPDTVIELQMKPAAYGRYDLDDFRTFKGILQLNKQNIDHLTYVLKEAEPVD